jgi:hypothetical protein
MPVGAQRLASYSHRKLNEVVTFAADFGLLGILIARVRSEPTDRQASGMPYTIVVPVFFMENLFQPSVLASLRQGKLAVA